MVYRDQQRSKAGRCYGVVQLATSATNEGESLRVFECQRNSEQPIHVAHAKRMSQFGHCTDFPFALTAHRVAQGQRGDCSSDETGDSELDKPKNCAFSIRMEGRQKRIGARRSPSIPL